MYFLLRERFKFKVSVFQDPCSNTNCTHPLAMCKVTNKTATCYCPKAVTLEYYPVCGSDGVTYPNPGSLEVADCESGGAITKIHDGDCEYIFGFYFLRFCPK